MQKIYCTPLLVPALLILLSTFPSIAQNHQPTAVSTDNGIWIYLGNEIPDGFQYQVLKKEGDGNFSLIGTTSYPEDTEAMMARMEEFHPSFSHLEKPGDAELRLIQDYASRNKTTDSIYIPNFPMMHLALGTAFLDPQVQAGKSYQYMVRKIKDRNSQDWERTSNVLQYPVKTNILKPEFRDKQEFNSQILLRWFVPEKRNLNSFVIYRRVFGKGEYEKINTTRGFNTSVDTVYLIVMDTTVQNPALYEYYIKPLDIYGNIGPDSEVISAGTIGSAYYPVPEYFNARGAETDYQVELSWKFTDMQYLRSIEVYRSASFDDGYSLIARLSPNDSTFTDVVPVANENFYYYLIISGPVEKSLPSAKVSAMFRNPGEKPLPPDEIAAESIPGGITIYWSYHEPHAKGFYVYRYVYEKAEYMQVSGLIPAGAEIYSFKDSSSYLQGNDIYRYALRAINDVDQMSDFSESASASPGIKADMGSPVNLRINQTDNGILLVWDDMRDAEPVLMGYKMYRKTNPDEAYSLLPNDTLRNDKNYYKDTVLMAGKSYTYSVSAIDFYGNESVKSNPVIYHTEAEYYIFPDISKLVNTPDGIVISWEQITDEHVISIKIYRSQPGGQPAVIATLEKDSEEYLDTSVSEGELYIYEILLVRGDGKDYSKSRGGSVRR
jgi:uncharacterized protein